MKVFTYSEARQNLSELLNTDQTEEVVIRRKDDSIFSIVPKTENEKSPLDVAGIKTMATTQDILDAVKESRAG